jgi:hypothetical protein
MFSMKRDELERWGVIGLGVAAISLFAVSYFFSYWSLTLYAPQYPDGLTLEIFLDHLEGDVREINGLNHYIGMEKLQHAAEFEKQIAEWALGGLCLMIILIITLAPRKYGWIAIIPAILFPIGFVADSYYWLYTFGQNLDPRAPINIEPFVPTFFGEGKIAQFKTIAVPGTGFYLALAGAALVFASWLLRRSVCGRCELKGECHRVCPRAIVRRVDEVAEDEEKTGAAK